MAEYIERDSLAGELERIYEWHYEGCNHKAIHDVFRAVLRRVRSAPAADVVPVVHGYHDGDVCIYGFGHENKSRALVEIVRILNDERGVAEVKFHKVFVDDTGNGFFNYLLRSGGMMNASFQYLKNITPRMDGE